MCHINTWIMMLMVRTDWLDTTVKECKWDFLNVGDWIDTTVKKLNQFVINK